MDVTFCNDFEYSSEYTYLATASESILLTSHRQACNRYFEHKALGQAGHETMYETVKRCRNIITDLIDAGDEANIAFLSSTSHALSNFTNSINLRAGENIVVSTLDFISNFTAGLPFVSRGVELRVVKALNGKIDSESIVRYVDDRTRLVIVSLVSHWSGYRHNLPMLSKMVREKGAYLAVDATQALGLIPVQASYCDFLVASVYKWLLGVPGIAIVYCNPRIIASLNPTTIGWQGLESWDISIPSYKMHDNSRLFEMGFPNFAGIYILENALQYLKATGLDYIHRKTEKLVTLLLEELKFLGMEILTPIETDHRGGIISLRTVNYREVGRKLANLGFLVSTGEGRIRIAPYFYNDEEDIRSFIAAMKMIRD